MPSSDTAYCRRCMKEVQYHFDAVNHFAQLLLTVFTLGLWLPIWVCMVLRPTKLCDECDGPLWSEQR